MNPDLQLNQIFSPGQYFYSYEGNDSIQSMHLTSGLSENAQQVKQITRRRISMKRYLNILLFSGI
jgi:hypothetical protein